MSDPGLDWERMSYHTLSLLAQCDRAGYWQQAIGVRPQRGPSYNEALETGQVGHAFMEWWYHPERDNPEGCRLDGVDGAPTVFCADDIVAWFSEPQQIDVETIRPAYSSAAVTKARESFERYCDFYVVKDAIREHRIGSPEWDLDADLRGILPPRQGTRPIPYQARLDAVVADPFGRPSPGEGAPSGVYVVEHKFIKTVSAGMVSAYAGSGQIVGCVAAWNASGALVAKYGPAKGVLVNLIPKTWTGKAKPHREYVAISKFHQQRFAESVGDVVRGLRHAQKYNEWQQRGMIAGKCVDNLTGWACPFLDICRNGVLSSAEFRWPVTNTERIIRDGHARIVSGFGVDLQARNTVERMSANVDDVDLENDF